MTELLCRWSGPPPVDNLSGDISTVLCPIEHTPMFTASTISLGAGIFLPLVPAEELAQQTFLAGKRYLGMPRANKPPGENGYIHKRTIKHLANFLLADL